MGPGRFELPTSRLSGVRSHQLSYEPDHTAVSDSNTAVILTSRLSRLNHLSTCSKSNKKCRCSCGSATLLRVREFTYSPPSSQDKNFIFSGFFSIRKSSFISSAEHLRAGLAKPLPCSVSRDAITFLTHTSALLPLTRRLSLLRIDFSSRAFLQKFIKNFTSAITC